MYSINTKVDVTSEGISFIKLFWKQNVDTVKKIHMDRGNDFLHALGILGSPGVRVFVTTSYTPQLNGLVERMHQTFVSSARACLHHANMPTQFWNYSEQQVVQCRSFVRYRKDGLSPF